MCLNPNKRFVESHVEWETDSWISVFNVTLSLSRVIKVFGEAFGDGGAGVRELLEAVNIVTREILRVCMMREERLDKAKFSPPQFKQVRWARWPMSC